MSKKQELLRRLGEHLEFYTHTKNMSMCSFLNELIEYITDTPDSEKFPEMLKKLKNNT